MEVYPNKVSKMNLAFYRITVIVNQINKINFFSYNKKVDKNECFGDNKSNLCFIIFLETGVSFAISNVIKCDLGINKIISLF